MPKHHQQMFQNMTFITWQIQHSQLPLHQLLVGVLPGLSIWRPNASMIFNDISSSVCISWHHRIIDQNQPVITPAIYYIDANLLFPKGLYGPLNCLSHHKYLNPNEGPLPAKSPFYFFPTWQVHKQQSFDLRVVTLVVPRDFRTWLTKALPLHGGQIGDGESGWRSRCQSLYPTQNSWVPWALCVQGSPGKRKQRVPMHYALGANTHPWISSKANVDPYVQPDIENQNPQSLKNTWAFLAKPRVF